jgi:hypothetical protein
MTGKPFRAQITQMYVDDGGIAAGRSRCELIASWTGVNLAAPDRNGAIMRPLILTAVAAALPLSSAFALDLPARKPGLWEITVVLEGGRIPPQAAQHCIDADTDKMMGAMGAQSSNCTKQDAQRVGDTITVDSVCKLGGATVTSHGVITGDFSSGYTVKTTSKREGAAMPGMPAKGETQMTLQAKWLGACKPDQKPGDMILANGMKMNIRDMQKAAAGAGAMLPKR